MVRLKALAVALNLPVSYAAADRLRGSSSQQEAVVTAASTEDFSEIDVQSSGIDRSLASIHESELSFLNDEQLAALGEYITRYSKDGNTDIPETCPFDYEGDVDPYHPDSFTTLGENGRLLMGEMDMSQEMAHAHMHYVESSCNNMLDIATCVNWSQWVDTNNITMSSEVRKMINCRLFLIFIRAKYLFNQYQISIDLHSRSLPFCTPSLINLCRSRFPVGNV